jgi:hypothetical protein
VITELIAAVGPLVGNRLFPMRADQGTEKPFATFQRAGGQPVNTFCGVSTKQNGRFQFNVWANSPEEASDLMEQIVAVLTEPPFRGVTLSQPQDVPGYDTRTFGVMQDISLWWAPPT